MRLRRDVVVVTYFIQF